MSPLDDELRAALHGRAAVLTPSPDPLAGIERRARRLRRNRAATAVAGSVLAVAAIAVAVPVLTPTSSGPAPGPAASTGPSAAPSPSAAPEPGSAYRLDVAAPWTYRGEALPQGFLSTLEKEYALRRAVDGAATAPRTTPLYGRDDGPGGSFELVFLATTEGRPPRWGVARSSEAGLQFAVDAEAVDGAYALSSLLDGDAAPRLLVVASPEAEAGSLQFRPDAVTPYADMERLAPGVGTVGVPGDPAAGSFRVLDRQGGEVHRSAVLDLRVERPSQAPDNRLEWPFRGPQDDALVERAVQAYAQAKGVGRDDVEWDVLLNGGTDGGLVYSVLQAWVRGERAQVFALVERPGQDPEPVLRPLTDPGVPVVALLLTDVPGRTTDELVVIPQPRTGQVLYTPLGGEQRPVEPAPGLDGVVLIDRERDAQADRLMLLDGNGDLDRATFEGPVLGLLCGEKGCG